MIATDLIYICKRKDTVPFENGEDEYGSKVIDEVLDYWEEKMKIKVKDYLGKVIVHLYECKSIMIDPLMIDHDIFTNITLIIGSQLLLWYRL